MSGVALIGTGIVRPRTPNQPPPTLRLTVVLLSSSLMLNASWRQHHFAPLNFQEQITTKQRFALHSSTDPKLSNLTIVMPACF
jgi:hypothetical protein